jgi:5-methylcytosine-specific restriction endonuclease McrA
MREQGVLAALSMLNRWARYPHASPYRREKWRMPFATKEAQREYARKWVAARRSEYFRDKKCMACGSNFDLELDHIDPSTKISHTVWSWTEQRRHEELAKCQVLCNSCHKDKTKQDIASRAEHGTLARYKSQFACKCDPCRTANAQYEHTRRRATGEIGFTSALQAEVPGS